MRRSEIENIIVLISKYERYISSIQWHVEKNSPTQLDKAVLSQRIEDFKEVVKDLKKLYN